MPPPAVPHVLAMIATPSASSSGVRKRKRLCDGPGLPQQTFTDCGSIHGLWAEYVGQDGKGGLRKREVDNPGWRGDGAANKPSRNLWTDKLFYYREIARQAQALSSLPDALAAVQARLEGHRRKGRGGWGSRTVGLLAELTKEQPESRRTELQQLLGELDTSL